MKTTIIHPFYPSEDKTSVEVDITLDNLFETHGLTDYWESTVTLPDGDTIGGIVEVINGEIRPDTFEHDGEWSAYQWRDMQRERWEWEQNKRDKGD